MPAPNLLNSLGEQFIPLPDYTYLPPSVNVSWKGIGLILLPVSLPPGQLSAVLSSCLLLCLSSNCFVLRLYFGFSLSCLASFCVAVQTVG